MKPKVLNQKLREIAKNLPKDYYEAPQYKKTEGRKTYCGHSKYPVSHYGRMKQAFFHEGIDGVAKYCKKYNFTLRISRSNEVSSNRSRSSR